MKETYGDLVKLAKEGKFDVLVQGCNCFQTQGKGIAKQVKETFPLVYQADREFGEAGDYNKLGCYSYAARKLEGGKSLFGVNAYTQYDYWSPGDPGNKVYVDYVAVRLVFRKIKKGLGGKGLKFGIPLIGAGLAKGDWRVISTIIEEEMAGEDLTLVRYEA